MADEDFMRQAFDLAEQGRGETHPNPLVGAVIVRGGRVVGVGYHRGPGLPHAEIEALLLAGDAARGATLYCTLEPCSHQGRTPPCAEALIAAGVARVVIPLQDPNPQVNGRGIQRLRAAGVRVDVLTGEMRQRAEEQNAAFLKFVRCGLPLVRYKAAVSLDGKVAAASGDARWISCSESRHLVHAMRAAADAVMVGAGTIRRDDPELTVRLTSGRDPVRVIVSHSGDVPLSANVVTTTAATSTLMVVDEMDAARRVAFEGRGVEIIESRGDLPAALRALAERGLLDILLEGGPSLASAMIAAGLVDRIAVFVAPLLVGDGAPELFRVPAPAKLANALRLREPHWRQVGEDGYLEARLEVG